MVHHLVLPFNNNSDFKPQNPHQVKDFKTFYQMNSIVIKDLIIIILVIITYVFKNRKPPTDGALFLQSFGCHEIFSNALAQRVSAATNIYKNRWLSEKHCGFCNRSLLLKEQKEFILTFDEVFPVGSNEGAVGITVVGQCVGITLVNVVLLSSLWSGRSPLGGLLA